MSTSVNQIPHSLSAAIRNPNGEISLHWDAVKNAFSYIVQKRELRNGKITRWLHYDIVNEPFCIIAGLKQNQSYEFRIAAVTDRGQKHWSEVISKKIIL